MGLTCRMQVSNVSTLQSAAELAGMEVEVQGRGHLQAELQMTGAAAEAGRAEVVREGTREGP